VKPEMRISRDELFGPAVAVTPFDTIEEALLADGVAKDKLYPLDIDRAFRSLDKIKKDVAVWWTGGAQTSQMLKTGEVDMSSYEYKAQSKWGVDEEGKKKKSSYINFDYGFWDDASHCFWHANHMDYGDPARPMIVLQSTRDKFAAGYLDFDRIIYCVARAENYDPAAAAMAHAGGGR